MTTINLYQQAPQERKKNNNFSLTSGGLIYSIAILFLVLVLLGGVKYYRASLVKRNADLDQQIAEKNKSFYAQEMVDQVVDIQARVDIIGKNINSQLAMIDVLHNLASDMVSGVSVTSYKYDGQKVTASFLSNNFADASRQILNLKKSKNFSNMNLASINKTSSTEGGEDINFEANMAVAPNVGAQPSNTN